jgi:hypothetical protein
MVTWAGSSNVLLPPRCQRRFLTGFNPSLWSFASWTFHVDICQLRPFCNCPVFRLRAAGGQYMTILASFNAILGVPLFARNLSCIVLMVGPLMAHLPSNVFLTEPVSAIHRLLPSDSLRCIFSSATSIPVHHMGKHHFSFSTYITICLGGPVFSPHRLEPSQAGSCKFAF